jgi:HPt (histidine-containing phosphotransfer) domain-containing protein
LPSESWDLSRALEGLGRDEEFLSELAGIYCAACPTLLKNLEQAIAANNLPSAADAAHLLWSGARTLSAIGVAKAALAVEMIVHRHELDDVGGAYRSLQQEAAQLLDALAEFRSRRDGMGRNPGPRQP